MMGGMDAERRIDGPEGPCAVADGPAGYAPVKSESAATGAVTRLAAVAGLAAVAAVAVVAGDDLLGDADGRTADDVADQAAETLTRAVPALEALDDLLPKTSRPTPDTADSTAGESGRLHYDDAEPSVAAVTGDGPAETRGRTSRTGANAADGGGRTKPRTDGRSASPRPKRSERVASPSEEDSPERPAAPRSGVLGAPETSGTEKAPGAPAPDVQTGVEVPDASTPPSTSQPTAEPPAAPDGGTASGTTPAPDTSTGPETSSPTTTTPTQRPETSTPAPGAGAGAGAGAP